MILEAVHRTVYTYPSSVRESHNEVRLAPVSDASQTCRDFTLHVSPLTEIFNYETPGGLVHHFGVRGQHERLEVVARARVETHVSDPFVGVDLLQTDWAFYEAESTRQAYAEFLCDSPYVRVTPEIRAMASSMRKDGQTVTDYLIDLNGYLNGLLTYDPDATHVHSQLDEVLALKAGVCQDYAHLMVACCRAMGIPARYVSGYLYGGEGIRGEQATHAWLDCVLPDAQWLSLDPTNNLLANDHHIRVHTGRDYADAAPFKGIYVGPPSSSLEVSVEVRALFPVGV